MKTNKTIGTFAITINLIAIFFKILLGYRACWEIMLLIVALGFVFTLITAHIQKNMITWIAIATGALSILLFLLEQFLLHYLFKNEN